MGSNVPLKSCGKLDKKCTYISGESSLATFIATSLSKGEAPWPTQTCENILGASKLSNIFLWNIQSCDSLTHRFSVLCSSIKTSSVSKEAAFSGWTCTALTSWNCKDKIYSLKLCAKKRREEQVKPRFTTTSRAIISTKWKKEMTMNSLKAYCQFIYKLSNGD